MTTRARDFKFAGTPVQRLQLAMVALTQKSFSAQYAWFSRGRSHMCSGLGKGAIWAQVVILRKRGSKFNDIHINILIKQRISLSVANYLWCSLNREHLAISSWI